MNNTIYVVTISKFDSHTLDYNDIDYHFSTEELAISFEAQLKAILTTSDIHDGMISIKTIEIDHPFDYDTIMEDIKDIYYDYEINTTMQSR